MYRRSGRGDKVMFEPVLLSLTVYRAILARLAYIKHLKSLTSTSALDIETSQWDCTKRL